MSYQEVVDDNHKHESMQILKSLLLSCRGKGHGVDPDAFRGDFMLLLEQGADIPGAFTAMKDKYELYPKPIIEEEAPIA